MTNWDAAAEVMLMTQVQDDQAIAVPYLMAARPGRWPGGWPPGQQPGWACR